MKRWIVIFGVIMSTLGCKTYKVSTIASTNAIKNPETGLFIHKNDSLSIKYSFYGNNMPLNIEVVNHLQEPLFVDWEQSALVIGENTYSFVDEKTYLQAKVTSTEYNDLSSTAKYYYSDIQGTAKISQTKTFIPPGAKVTRSIYALGNVEEIKLKKSDFRKISMASDSPTGLTYVSNASFNEANSPIQFKCFITVFTLKDNLPNNTLYQNEFYVSEITKTCTNPSQIYVFKNQKDAHMINKKNTGFTKALIAVGVVGLAGVVAANETKTDQKMETP